MLKFGKTVLNFVKKLPLGRLSPASTLVYSDGDTSNNLAMLAIDKPLAFLNCFKQFNLSHLRL